MAEYKINIPDDLMMLNGKRYEPTGEFRCPRIGEVYWRREDVRVADINYREYRHIILREVQLTGWEWVKAHVGKYCRHKPTGVCFFVRRNDSGSVCVCGDGWIVWASNNDPILSFGSQPNLTAASFSDDTVEVCPWPGDDAKGGE